MEFLVRIDVQWPTDKDPEALAALKAAERTRALELGEVGTIRRLWRIPGQSANWGIWEAADAPALHAAISSLPMAPWISVTVHPLAAHPSDPERPGGC